MIEKIPTLKSAAESKAEPYLLGKQRYEPGIFGLIDKIPDQAAATLYKAYERLLPGYKDERKIREALAQVDFPYIELLLKKVIKKSAEAAGVTFQDFRLSEKSVSYDSSIDGYGVAHTALKTLTINPKDIVKDATKLQFTDKNLMREAVTVVIHEAIHLLAIKGRNTGFTQGEVYTAANEGMTELLAQAIGGAYCDFAYTGVQDERRIIASYESSGLQILALMALIARDNEISLDAVVQAFTVSYFCDDSVLSCIPQFKNISEDARGLVRELKSESAKGASRPHEDIVFSEDMRALLYKTLNHNDVKDVSLETLLSSILGHGSISGRAGVIRHALRI